MFCGLDTNVLVRAHLPVLTESETVRENLRSKLGDDNWQIVLTAVVLHEFVHVTTDQRRFNPPVPLASALALAKGYLARPNVDCLLLDGRALQLASHLLERHRLGHKRIADTLLAATLLRHGVNSIMTCNPSNFAVFNDLEVIDPRNANEPRSRSAWVGLLFTQTKSPLPGRLRIAARSRT